MNPPSEEAIEAAVRGETPYLRPIERKEVVLRLAARGVSSGVIARHLKVDEATVRRILRGPKKGDAAPAKKLRKAVAPKPTDLPHPKPTLCTCGAKRIDHRGGGQCLHCPCNTFRRRPEPEPSATINTTGSLSERTIEIRRQTALAVRYVIHSGIPRTEAAKLVGISERTLGRALQARRAAA